MTRLSLLVGIGLMLVGAMAYALPTQQELTALVPALAGVIMAAIGIIARHHDRRRSQLIRINTLLAVGLLVFASIRIVPDTLVDGCWSIPFIADLDTLGLSAVFLYFAIKSFLETKGILKATQKSNEED